MKSRSWPLKSIVIAVICFLVGVGTGLLGYHFFYKPGVIQSTKIEPTKRMVEKVIDTKSEDGIGMVSLLTRRLHELNSQCKCIWSEGEIQEMKEEDRCVELIFKSPTDVIISKWVEPEERQHIPVDEKGYRILGNIENALFILEDNLGEALETHILVGHEVDGGISYSCWAIDIKSWGKTEHDKTWIDSLDRIISELP